MSRLFAFAVFAALTAAGMPVAAAAEADPPQRETPMSGGVIGAEPSNWSLGVALGYGIRSNPLIQSDDIPILVDLDVAWFGEHFFFDNGDLGLTMSDNDRFTISLVARLNSDRVFFGRTDTRIVQISNSAGGLTSVEVNVPDRDYAVEMGAELLTDGGWGRLQLTAFHDVSDTHGGYQLRADYSYGMRNQRWYFEPAVGISMKSRRLVDYYWGVGDDESNLALPAYRAEGGTNLSLRMLGSYQLTAKWAVSAVVEYERLNDEAAASPLAQDRYVTGFFTGFAYRF